MKRAVRACSWFICALALASACRAADDLPAPEGVLQKVLAHARASALSESKSYLYTKQTVTQDIDPAGRITSRKVQVRTSRARPIGPADASKWSNSHGVNLDEELLARYSLKLVGRVALRGRPTLEITFGPKHPPMPVHRALDRLLNRAAGAIWVDEEDYELAQAELRLTEPVNLVVLGAIDDLSFHFERSRSAEGSWLTTRTETNFRGRRLLNPVQFRQVTEYTGYKRIESDQLVRF
jgi:hypothetical protein